MKKVYNFLLASILLVGMSTVAFASEDINSTTNAADNISPQSGYARNVTDQVTIPNPVLSVSDYQTMNDNAALTVSDRSSDNSSDIPDAERIANAEKTENERQAHLASERAKALRESEKSAAENRTINPYTTTTPNNSSALNAGTNPNIAIYEENVPLGNLNNARGVNDHPATGAADMAPMLIAALTALGAAPIVLRAKKK